MQKHHKLHGYTIRANFVVSQICMANKHFGLNVDDITN